MQTDIRNTTQTDMASKVSDYEVTPQTTDGVQNQRENYWDNEDFTKWFGYYKKIPELKKAIDAYSTWVLGKGYKANARTQIKLDRMIGWGEDTFNSILWNMLVIKKVNGDSYAEVIYNEEGELINIKPLDPSSMRTIVNEKGKIIRYEQRTKVGKSTATKKYTPNQILHLCNDRVADEIHGTSVAECVQWVIDARNEAMRDWKRISHRSTIRILYIDEDNKTRLANMKRDYAEAINNGELLILPVKNKEAEFTELQLPPVESFLSWIRYLENFFYQAVGIPKVILGGSEEFTEASSKISYLTYEQIYTREVVELEADLFNQLGIKIKFNKPASLQNEMLSSEEKNTGQTGFQPNDTQAGVGR